MAAPQVTAGDRLGFTLFLALAVHGVLLFGVGFAPEGIESGQQGFAVIQSLQTDVL